MPRMYEHIRDSYEAAGKPEKAAKRLAAMTYIANGKGGNRSSRAKSLHSDSMPMQTHHAIVHGRLAKMKKKGMMK